MIELNKDLIHIKALLPDSIQELIGVIGMDGTLALIRHQGGVNCVVPKYPDHETPLTQWLNECELAAMCRYYGGTSVYIPRCYKAITAR